jgi:hypothetical protein
LAGQSTEQVLTHVLDNMRDLVSRSSEVISHPVRDGSNGGLSNDGSSRGDSRP